MNEQGRFLAKVLDSGLNALAAGTAVRQREALRAIGTRLPSDAFEDLIGDTESHLLHLAEALATDRPALFVERVHWNRTSLVARDLPEDTLAIQLNCLRQELEWELPRPANSRALEMVDMAIQTFESAPRPIQSSLEASGTHAKRIRQILLAMLEARRGDALDLVVGAAEEGLSVSEIEIEILAAIQKEVGRMWQRGEIGVHEEHLGSQIIEESLTLLRGKMNPSPSRGKTVLVCSVQGETHDIGTRIVADHFEMDGWNALRLGKNLPGSELAKACEDFSADLVALSVTMSTHVRTSALVIESLRSAYGSDSLPVLIGGPPFCMVPDLWQVVGADGSAMKADEAMAVARSLVGV